MLTQGKVLNYIKGSLSFPHSELELSDDQITDKIINQSLVEFSYYSPEVKNGVLDCTNENLKVSGIQNEFYISDDQGLELLNVIQVFPTASDYWIHGHPVVGAMTFGQLQDFALSTFQAMTTKQFSPYDITFEFKHPNILRISPVSSLNNTFVYSYERMHNPDLSGIPNELQMIFMKFAMADVMITVGRIRKKYGDGRLTTPFGDIPLDVGIFDEGKELKREIVEKLEMGPLLNVVFDVG